MIKSATTKAVLSNTAYQIIGKTVSMSVTILATIIIARMYEKQGYGAFTLMQAIPALFFIIVDFGFNAIATRELSKDFGKAEKYFGNIMVMRVLMSFLLILLAGIAITFFPYSQSLKIGIYLGLFIILTQALYSTTNIIFQTKLRYDYSTIGLILGSLVILVLVLVLSYNSVSVMWVNFSYVIGGFVTFFVNLHFIKRFINLKLVMQIDRALWKFLFFQAWPLGLMFIFSQINFKADSILLSVLPVPAFLNLSNTEAVGVYGLPYKVFEVALVVPTFFMNAVYPIYVRHMEVGQQKLKYTFSRSVKALFVFGIFAAVVGVIFAPFAIGVLGGEEFSQSISALRLLLLGLPILFITQPFAWLIVTLGKQIYLPIVYLIGAVFNLVANVMLIPVYSFYASAVITWVSEIIILVLLVFFAYKSWKKHYA